MQFLLKSILLLGALVWLIVSAKTLLALGVMENPSVVKDHLLVLVQLVAALLILRSLTSKSKRDSY
ncbi:MULTISPECIES: hypothetical protein [Shewanella]|jgi:hypothetical protein|uniref:Uncharacterized protein n=2 Tax=Shewanella TaxID=22 RepID=A0AAJ1EZ74_9GAMM|nr:MULTISPECIES: hypothetical protein [Shewanella]AZQ09517.1 hypothetical protein STH12_00366 [Shewanella khirikhana]MCH4293227.1 hypothetical protein [Shewanella zhuhaiensis]